jgi:hypothetical protein
MNRALILLFFFVFFYSCSSDTVPDNVLAPKKMESVLWDVIMADEMADYYVQKDSSLKALDNHVDLYRKLFSIHKISKEQFSNSLKYYEKRPDLLKPIFDSLQKRSERQTIRTKPV